MQYIYVLDHFISGRMTIKIADDVDISGKIDDILSVNHLKESECSWLVSNKPLDDEIITGVITKI